MADDRRSARRARLSGVRVTYEGVSGKEQSADVTDLSREGVFIESATPLAVGKRISLEIMATGEPAPWSALGRVVWIRETGDGDDAPAGMAVKIIDAEDTVHAAIERLIETRERTEPGLGEGGWDFEKPPPERPRVLDIPARERTVLGVGIDPAPVAAAPVLRAAPVREATLVGVGASEADDDDREPSLAIDLVQQKPTSGRAPPPALEEPSPPASERAANASSPPAPTATSAPPPARPSSRAPAREDSEPAASLSVPRRSSGGWLVVLVLIAACGGAGFAFRAKVVPVVHRVIETVTRQLR